jgi:hypothetical protein
MPAFMPVGILRALASRLWPLDSTAVDRTRKKEGKWIEFLDLTVLLSRYYEGQARIPQGHESQ